MENYFKKKHLTNLLIGSNIKTWNYQYLSAKDANTHGYQENLKERCVLNANLMYGTSLKKVVSPALLKVLKLP